MSVDIAAEQYVQALDSTVDRLLWEAGIVAPPVDVFRIARDLGIAVAIDAKMKNRARIVRRNGREPGETIYVGPEPRFERRQWAVAHEIGETSAAGVCDALGVDGAAAALAAREHLANQLARRLLLPTRWFETDGESSGWDLLALKRRYSTASHELVARRMLDMRPPVVITLCDQGQVVWRCSNAGTASFRMSVVEAALWQRTHVSGRPASVVTDPLETGFDGVRSWPIHESGWRREIVRADLACVE